MRVECLMDNKTCESTPHILGGRDADRHQSDDGDSSPFLEESLDVTGRRVMIISLLLGSVCSSRPFRARLACHGARRG